MKNQEPKIEKPRKKPVRKDNTGDRNTGDLNTGHLNTGYLNTGDRNTGDRNTGDRNTGDLNTGDLNTGDLNTGYLNTGDLNTGHLNTGDRNTGDLNTGDRNTGYLNTNEPPMRVCNMLCAITQTEYEREHGAVPIYPLITEWVEQSDMTKEEKDAHPEFGSTGGFLRRNDFKEAFIKAFNGSTVPQKDWFLKLPNFNAEIFLEITGVDVRENVSKPSLSGKIVTVELDGEKYTAIIQ